MNTYDRTASRMIGGFEWEFTPAELDRAGREDIYPCRRCRVLEPVTLLDADNWCGRCG